MAGIHLDENDQKQMIELIIANPSVFARVKSILKSEYFDKKFQPTIEYLLNFSAEYNSLPLLEQLNNEARIEYKKMQPYTNTGIEQSVLDMAESFAKQRALEIAVDKAYGLIASGQHTGIDEIIKEAQMISLKKDLGMNFWENPSEWLEQQESEQGILPTGWKTFDDLMNGGFGWGELNYVVAPANSGKSLCMQNLAINWSMMGYNVLFLTLEMNRALVGKRMASMVSNVPYKDIRFNINDVSNKLIYKRKDIKPGLLQLVDMPIGCTANDIESLIQEFEIDKGVQAHIIVIDYADIMTPCDKRINQENIHICDKRISLELRSIVRERTKNGKNSMVFTASQITKDAMDEMEFGLGNIAGGTGKSTNADNIFSVRTNDSMRQRGEYEFKFLKTRNSGAKDKKLKMRFNIDTLLISDLEEVTTQNTVFNNAQSLNNALETLKGLTIVG